MIPIREEWLNLTDEEVIDPDIPICDPHHHLWYGADIEYTIDQLVRDLNSGHKIVKTVFIESRLMLDMDAPIEKQPVGETDFVQKLFSQNSQNSNIAIAAGIVGFADLTLGNAVVPVLEAHIEASKSSFRGVRHTCAWDSDPIFKSRHNIEKELLSDSRFREGFSCLQKYDLNFDAWIFHPQLPELADLAKKHPETKIIINHTGGLLGIGSYARDREEVLSAWRNGISSLAVFPNVYLKLGGLGMEINGFGWPKLPVPPNSADLARAMSPIYLYCIEQFGVKRCMFESNFPVDKQSYSYSILWNAFKKIVNDFSYAEKLAVFHDTAAEVYKV